MSHEKRLALALILSMAVCLIWAHFMTQKHLESQKLREQQKKIEKVTEETPSTSTKSPGQEPGETGSPSESKAPDETPVAADPEAKRPADPEAKRPDEGKAKEAAVAPRTERYENDVYCVAWSSRGAGLRYVKFKQFWNGHAKRENAGWENEFENWFTIIPGFASEVPSLAFFGKTESGLDLATAVWKVVKSPEDTPDTLEFELVTPRVTYRKIFSFHPGSYFVSGKIVLENTSAEERRERLEIGGGSGIFLEDNEHTVMTCHAMHLNKKGHPLFEEYSYQELMDEEVSLQKTISWAALTSRHFAHVFQIENSDWVEELGVRAFLPDRDWIDSAVETYKSVGEYSRAENIRANPKQAVLLFRTREISIPAGGKASMDFRFHIASKSHLASQERTFEEVDSYGFFGIVSRFLLWCMRLFYGLFQNYGIAIVCLTLAIKLVLYPVSRKQQISMQNYQKKMAQVQPMMRKLQEKYKNNRQKLNEEMMKLYKENKVSVFPLGGCLPIFIQLPIFIGLYSALSYSIDLRQAEFLWITDLSQPDRIWQFARNTPLLGGMDLNLLPILMTVIWFIQMKTAPMPEDPQMQQQQKIMTIMPIIFGFLFYSLASGLVLYWLVMQLMTIFEQFWIKKTTAARAA